MDQTQNITKPLRRLEGLRTLKPMWKLELFQYTILPFFTRQIQKVEILLLLHKEDNQEQSKYGSYFPRRGLASPFAIIPPYLLSEGRHQFQTPWFSFNSVQQSAINLQLEYTVIFFHETLQCSERSLSRLSMSYTPCPSRYKYLYYLFKPYEIG